MKTPRCLLALFAAACIPNAWADNILVQDDFNGAAGSAPNAAEYQCGGPVTLNGSGEVNLNTIGTGSSWMKSIDSATAGVSQTLVLRFRGYAYAENWNPGIYGNGQPRGLRVGTDADNAIEFYSVANNLLGMRTRANGVETSATFAVGSVYDWHDYEITVSPGSAAFKVDGTTAATLATNLPSGALNAHFATTTHVGNVPIALESLSFLVQSPPPAITSFAPSSGPVGTSVVIAGANLTGATAIKFGGVDATAFTVDSTNQITSTVPTGAITGAITVVTPAGSATSGENFAVTELSQTISFDPLPIKEIGTSPFALTATASSGLPVSYSSSNPHVATVSGNTITIHGIGSSIITADQPGSGSFLPAPTVGRLLKVRGAPSRVAGWGYNGYRQCNAPDGLDGVVEVAAGSMHTLALKADGTVVAWGDNSSGQCNVPPDLIGVVDIACGGTFSMALKADGKVVAWGFNQEGQCNVPPDLDGVVAVTCGIYHGAALKADGTVVVWGDTRAGLRDIPSGLKDVVAIAAGAVHTLALKHDGTVVAWTYNSSGQCNVPAGLSGIVAIDAGNEFSMALRNDGSVVVWGGTQHGWSGVLQPPAGLADIAAISAGCSSYCASALKHDGTVVSWGDPSSAGCDVPAGLANVTSISGGSIHTLAITPAPTPPPVFLYWKNGSEIHISGYVGSESDVVIPDTIAGLPVTTVTSGTFKGNTSVRSITLQATLTNIQLWDDYYGLMTSAFEGCSNLVSFHVADGNSVYSSTDGVLFSSDKSTLLRYPTARSGDYSVPSGTEAIGASAFSSCTGMTRIHLPDSISSIGACAFMASSLTAINLPQGITEIGWHTFNACNLSAIAIPDSVLNIRFSAFMGCPNLASVSLPAGLQVIESWAFMGCPALQEIVLPASLASFHPGAFQDCAGLISVRFRGNAPALDPWVSETLFQNSPCTIYRLEEATGWPPVPEPWAGRPTAVWTLPPVFTYEIIAGTVTITKYNGPGGVVEGPAEIEGWPVWRIGHFWESGDWQTQGVFRNRQDITSVVLPAGIRTIGQQAFAGCTGITSITLPETVTDIGMNAFEGCTGLRGIVIPDSVTNVAQMVFFGCTGLERVVVGSGVQVLGDGVFLGCTGIRELVLSEGLQRLGADAFRSCSSLRHVVVPASVQYLDSARQFADCTSLRSVLFCGDCPAEGWGASSDVFLNCPNLEAVHFAGNGRPSPSDSWFENSDPTVYILPTSTGWPEVPGPWSGRPTAFWNRQPPQITAFTPLSGPSGSVITITGTALLETTQVRFGNSAAAFQIETDSRILAVVPQDVTTGPLTVVTPSGSVSTTMDFGVAGTFVHWLGSVFTPEQLADPSISSPMATPANDGITNLMKYALALDPFACGSSDLPTPGEDAGYLTLTFRQNKLAYDIDFSVEVCSEMGGWNTAGAEVSRTDGGDHWIVTVRDSVPITDSDKRFMRLKVRRE